MRIEDTMPAGVDKSGKDKIRLPSPAKEDGVKIGMPAGVPVMMISPG